MPAALDSRHRLCPAGLRNTRPPKLPLAESDNGCFLSSLPFTFMKNDTVAESLQLHDVDRRSCRKSRAIVSLRKINLVNSSVIPRKILRDYYPIFRVFDSIVLLRLKQTNYSLSVAIIIPFICIQSACVTFRAIRKQCSLHERGLQHSLWRISFSNSK